jgi:hypothetical protein
MAPAQVKAAIWSRTSLSGIDRFAYSSWFRGNALCERRRGYSVRSDEGDEGQMWAVVYDDGMSLTTASERIARSLAEAERHRGHRVTVRRLDDAETRPAERFARRKPIGEPEPTLAPELASASELTQVPGPAQAVEPTQAAEPASVPEPARAPTPAGRRRLLLYALAAACIVVAAALADHWAVLPRVGANTSSSSTQVAGPAHRPQLLPPLDQPPVMHFSSAVNATSPRSATAESSGGGPPAIARGG